MCEACLLHSRVIMPALRWVVELPRNTCYVLHTLYKCSPVTNCIAVAVSYYLLRLSWHPAVRANAAATRHLMQPCETAVLPRQGKSVVDCAVCSISASHFGVRLLDVLDCGGCSWHLKINGRIEVFRLARAIWQYRIISCFNLEKTHLFCTLWLTPGNINVVNYNSTKMVVCTSTFEKNWWFKVALLV